MSSGWFLTKQNFTDMDRIIQQHRKYTKNKTDFQKRKLFVSSTKKKSKENSILSSDNDTESSSLLTSDNDDEQLSEKSLSSTPETRPKPFSDSISPIESPTKPNVRLIETGLENLTISRPQNTIKLLLESTRSPLSSSTARVNNTIDSMQLSLSTVQTSDSKSTFANKNVDLITESIRTPDTRKSISNKSVENSLKSLILTPENSRKSESLSPIQSTTKKKTNFIEFSSFESLSPTANQIDSLKSLSLIKSSGKKNLNSIVSSSSDQSSILTSKKSITKSPSPIKSTSKKTVNFIDSSSGNSSIFTSDNTKSLTESPSLIRSSGKQSINLIESSILTPKKSITESPSPIKSTSKKKTNFIESSSGNSSILKSESIVNISSTAASSPSLSPIKSTSKKTINFIVSSSGNSSILTSQNTKSSILTPSSTNSKPVPASTTKKKIVASSGKKLMTTPSSFPKTPATLKSTGKKSFFPQLTDADFSSRKRHGVDKFHELRRRLNDICDSDSEKSLSGNESDQSETDSDRDCTKSPDHLLFSFCDSNASTDRSWLDGGYTCKYSFLESLSNYVAKENADPEAYEYRINFKTKRTELCTKLFRLYNRDVFDDKLSENLPIEWSGRLTGTAGHCWTMRREKMRFCRITLSNKVVDTADRLRDTLVHEMCHAAVFLIDNRCDGHGLYWKRWTSRAMLKFPELPPIRKCHNYAILKKFTYKCQECGYSIGRHSKSIDTKGQRCGRCHGQLQLFTNKRTKDGIVSTPFVERKLNEFAQFVKDNYAIVKDSCAYNENVMRILSFQFAEMKSKTAAAPVTPATDT